MDRAESIRRGSSQPRKTVTKHPYAAIEHRVIDSASYADLSFSARSLLTMLTRQITKDNNGHLQATHSYLERHGFSDRTITRGIAELIAHGFVYRTRSGGYQQGAAQYAVTWLPIKIKEGLFLDGFKPCAWRDWEPAEKKTPPPNLRYPSRKNGGLTQDAGAKFTARGTAKFTDNELIASTEGNSSTWMADYLLTLKGRGLAGHESFVVPWWNRPCHAKEGRYSRNA